ncbi:MAG: hypothetical protein AABW67_06250, partial [Nanoarchaeota archaeon]
MLIKKIGARKIKDSRGEFTIQVFVKPGFFWKFKTASPAGKSTGKYEVKSYAKDLDEDIEVINNIDVEEINELEIEEFEDLKKLEKFLGNKIGGNSLYALESSILKALANKKGKELFEFLNSNTRVLLRPVGNAIGGGLHSKGFGGKKPDFQEFLFIADGKTFSEMVEINNQAYKLTKRLLEAEERNDEGAWETHKTNEEVLKIMEIVKQRLKRQGMIVDIGIDCASSSFYKNKNYAYKNPSRKYDRQKQIKYLKFLIERFKILYVEDGLEENDFTGFSILNNIP